MKKRNHSPLLLIVGVALLLCAGCSSRGYRSAVPSAPLLPAPPPITAQNLPLRNIHVPAILAVARKPEFDAVPGMVRKAEAAFKKGEKDYRTGHLEMAKDEFNKAIDGLLQGPVDIRQDRRLFKTFDSLVDHIHSDELEALRQGDGFAQPTYQPAPMDELQDLTFPDNPQLRDKVRADAANTQSDIPLVINSQVASFIEYFTHGRGRRSLEAGLRRAGRYHDMIVRILREEGVPRDLVYVAQAESAFQDMARSRAGALGIWQFMTASGRSYGLKKNWWLDERLNPEKATRAAARHLRDLHNMFGDWYLALAAYNAGSNAVAAAVSRTGYADFWKLSRLRVLPKETRNYVPIIVALTIIAKHPGKYGLEDLLPQTPLVYDTVTVTSPVDLRLVAEIVGSNLKTIRELNPSLLRLTTPNVPEYKLRIPLATKEMFLKRIAMIPPVKRVWWRYHTVNYGETLSGIAHKLHSTPKAIAEVNNIDLSQPLRENTELVIPVTSARGIRHRVRRRETLALLARRYRVSQSDIMEANNLSSPVLRRGATLVIPSSRRVSTRSESSRRRTTRRAARHTVSGTRRASLIHKVRKGETLSEIAANYNTSVKALRRSNRQLGDLLPIGAEILIPAAK